MVGAAVVRTEALRGGGCCRSPETVREQAVCFLVEGDGLRRGGEPLFRGENGFERMLCGAVVAVAPRKRPGCRRRASLSEGTGCGGAASFSFGEGPDSDASPIASAIRLRCSLLSPAACHHPPPAITRRPLPPPPLLVTPVAVCLPAAVAFPLPVITRRPLPPLLTASSQPASPLSVAFPRLSLLPAARRYRPPPASFLLPPSPACHHPLLPAPPPLLTRRYRPPQQLLATPATLRNLPPPAACHFRRHAPAGRTDGLRRHPAWSVGARCVAGEKFCEIIWKIGKSFLSLFRLSIGVLAFRGRDSCFLLDYHSYGKRDYLSDGGRVQEAQGRA